MPATASFDVAVTPSRAFAYLSNPRNLIAANHKGPVIERSEGPFEAGSWYVLKFDQLRARVDYTIVEPDRRIAVQVSMSGLGSGGATSRYDYLLTPLDGGSRTRVVVAADGRGGCLRWGPLVRAAQSASVKRMREKMETST